MAYYKIGTTLSQVKTEINEELVEQLEKIVYCIYENVQDGDNSFNIEEKIDDLWFYKISTMKVSEECIEKYIKKNWDWEWLLSSSDDVLSVDFIDKHINILKEHLSSLCNTRQFKLSEWWFFEKYYTNLHQRNIISHMTISDDDVNIIFNKENLFDYGEDNYHRFMVGLIFNKKISVKKILEYHIYLNSCEYIFILLQLKKLNVDDFFEMKRLKIFEKNDITEKNALLEVCKNKCGVGLELFRNHKHLEWDIEHLEELVKHDKFTLDDLPLIDKYIPYIIRLCNKLLKYTMWNNYSFINNFLENTINKYKNIIYGEKYRKLHYKGYTTLLDSIEESITINTPIEKIEKFMEKHLFYSTWSIDVNNEKTKKPKTVFLLYSTISKNKTITLDFIEKHNYSKFWNPFFNNETLTREIIERAKQTPEVLDSFIEYFNENTVEKLITLNILNADVINNMSFKVKDTIISYLCFYSVDLSFFELICEYIEREKNQMENIKKRINKDFLIMCKFSEEQFIEYTKKIDEDETHPYRKYWKWKFISQNSHLTSRIVEKYKDNLILKFEILSCRHMSSEFIENVEGAWDYELLSSTQFLKPSYILKKPNENWNLEYILENNFEGYKNEEIEKRIKKHIMAYRIQCHWRKCYYDPRYDVCKKRIYRQYNEYVNEYYELIKNKSIL